MYGIASWRDHWDRFEACVGLVAAFVLSFALPTLSILTFIFATLLAEWKIAGQAGLIAVAVVPMAIWLARMQARQWRGSASPNRSRNRRVCLAVICSLGELPLREFSHHMFLGFRGSSGCRLPCGGWHILRQEQPAENLPMSSYTSISS